MKMSPILISLAVFSIPSVARRATEDGHRYFRHARDEPSRTARPCPTPAEAKVARRTPNPLVPTYKGVSGDMYGQGSTYDESNEYNKVSKYGQSNDYAQGKVHGETSEYSQGYTDDQDKGNEQGDVQLDSRLSTQTGSTSYTVCEQLPLNQRRESQEQMQVNQQQNQYPSQVEGTYTANQRCSAILSRHRERCEEEQRVYEGDNSHHKPPSHYKQIAANKNAMPGNGLQANANNNNYGAVTPRPTPTPTATSYSFQPNLECHVAEMSMATAMEKVRPLYSGSDPIFSGAACPATFQFENGPTTPDGMDQYVLTQSSDGTVWKCQYTTQIPGERDVRVSCLPGKRLKFICMVVLMAQCNPQCLNPSIIHLPHPHLSVQQATGANVYLGNLSSTDLSASLSNMIVTSCTLPMTTPIGNAPSTALVCPTAMTIPGITYVKELDDPRFYSGDLVAEIIGNTFFPSPEVLEILARAWATIANVTVTEKSDQLCTNLKRGVQNIGRGSSFHYLDDFPICKMAAEWLMLWSNDQVEGSQGVDAQLWVRLKFEMDPNRKDNPWDDDVCKAAMAVGIVEIIACILFPPTCEVVGAAAAALSFVCNAGSSS
ncbi:hypothetical protein LTR78_008145 [Recurvomyces mirabilis]|uniref:Uncharacterized protein n=1 Tax=Recurvomyces mirabilis TaxID=574656 RepID=A0AAE0WJ27_9PEZI|nr:hypothetical protein LTR78_008145 [Recurvomyces mirabilis]